MNTSSPIWQWSMTTTAAAIRGGEVSVTDVVDAHLARMAAVNPHLNAVVVDLGAAAREIARAADAISATDAPRGPLFGVPITVKINVDLEGQANSNGLVALKDHCATEDAPVIRNLRAAGAIVIGLTNTPEFSMGGFTSNPLHGLTRNPWDADITCGGSSGGAASAVAAGIGAMAHGNDLGGSLRWPAHCNGVVTIKPTPGRIPAFNPSAKAERPIMAQLMSCQGPLARTVDDVRLALQVMSAGDARDPWWVPAPLDSGAQGQPRAAMASIPADMVTDPAVIALYRSAARHLEDAGYAVDEIAAPDLDAAWKLWADLRVTEMAVQGEAAMRKLGSDNLGRMIDGFKTMGEVLDLPAYMQALGDRSAVLRNWLTMLERYDVMVTPVSVNATPPASAAVVRPGTIKPMFWNDLRFTSAVNLLGLPGAVVPVGVAGSMPVGVQIVSGRFREDRCLAAAAAIEQRVGVLAEQLWARM